MSQQPFADLEELAKTNKASSTQHGMPLTFVLEHAFPAALLCRDISKLG